MTEDKKKKKELGIYYTPKIVVNFIFDILNILKKKEDQEKQRWKSRKPRPHYPSVIDPAVGEGVFLKIALESSFTAPRYIFGIDIDEKVTKKWEAINLLKSFGSKANLKNHFFHQNGLLPLPEGRNLRYKKGGLKKFDAVVGNPPYGGVGLGETELTNELMAQLGGFEVLLPHMRVEIRSLNLQTSFLSSPKSSTVKPDYKKRIKSFPIEILFLERFIQLCKSGGWVAVIIPDGILANSSYHYVRQFIAERAKVLGIISLPRGTFKNMGTNAKTSIMFLQKNGEKKITYARDWDYPVFLGAISDIEKKSFNILAKNFKNFIYKGVLNND